MTHKIGDRIKEQATTSGTADFTFSGAVAGFRTLSAELTADGDLTWYCAVNGDEWELGEGTRLSASSLARSTVISSSNSDAKVAFSSPPVVFCTVPANVFLTAKPAFSAYRSTNAVIPANPSDWTLLICDTEEYDTASCYDRITGRFQPTTPGYYRLTANAFFSVKSTDAVSFAFYRNGVLAKRGPQPTAGVWSIGAATTIYLNGTTDYADCRVYSYAGVTVVGSQVGTYFQGELVAPA